MRRPLLLLAGAMAALVALVVWRDHGGPATLAAITWVREAGALGAAAFATLYVASVLLLLPGALLTLGAGLLYGPLWGTLLVSPASMLAAIAAFALARRTLRPWVVRRLGDHRRLAAIDRAIGERGGRIVLLLRLSPVVPFSAFNYLCGLTRVELPRYALASWLGMLPGTVLYCYAGSLAASAAQLTQGAPSHSGLHWAGLVATVVAAGVIAKVTRRAIQQALNQSPGM